MRLLAETTGARSEREALRHHPGRRLEPGEQDRQLANRARRLHRPAPPCNHACPGGENIQQWLYDAEEGGEGLRAPGARSWRTTRSPRSWGASATPARRRATAASSTRPSASTRSSASSATRRSRGWRVDALGEPTGKARPGGRRRASGLSAAYHLARLGHEVAVFDAGPMAGGMMRFGIPKYRLPRDVLDAEIQRILDLESGSS